ncbi:hypothetical protein OIV83_003850 [Microbotryomycetes sp. JL201]|nr:hypothetical protein OIV83_003850 [Microbotryomycetes sp. JL201]
MASSSSSSAAATPGTTTPAEDVVPQFAQLDLSLSRDQGTHHLGSGAGSEAHTLSDAADKHHGRVADRILSRTSVGHDAGGALSPNNLPKAPQDPPVRPPDVPPTIQGGKTPETASSSNVTSQQSSRVNTPAPASIVEPRNNGGDASTGPSSVVATPGESRVGTPAPVASSAATHLHPSSAATAPAHSSSSSSAPQKPPLKEKKSVFGKLFGQGGNASTQSLASTSNHAGGGTGTPSSTAGGHLSSERMERGASNDTSGSGSAFGVNGAATGAKAHGGGANIVRRTSKKEIEKQEKQEKKEQKQREKQEAKEQKEREREEHGHPRPRSSSHGNKDGGMGQALNDFMRNKVQRKSSQTSRKSDDGRSEHGGQESAYGGSTKGDDTKSRGGQSTASLSKKYGVCDKMIVGKGATAVVRLAHKWDRSSEKLYAVKEFRKRRKNETEKEYVKKLTSEFCISSTLHHHNIVETVDLVQDEQHHWCEVMEYCPGGDLYAAIKKGEMTPPEINSYFKQILAGVAYLHSMGVAHRDIKPENLLLDAKGHVKITDFGVSDVFRMCWEKTTHLSKGLCGSEPYIAPEQFEHKEYDARLVDVWACAVVFYCMHFQELPWRVAKPSDPSFGPYLQLYNESSAPAPISNLVPRECRNVIKRMLDPDPKTRATTEWIIADPWFDSIKVIPELPGILPPPKPGQNGVAEAPAAATPPLATPPALVA